MNEAAQQSASIIGARCPFENIDLALIIGDELRGASDAVIVHDRIAYSALPGFPIGAGVENAAVIIGTIDDVSTLVLHGVTTFHQTGDPSLMSGPMETLALLGANMVVMIGVAHSVNADLQSGAFVAVSDHINITGVDPLIGDTSANIDLTEAYDKRLLRRLKLAATTAVTPMMEGVLMWFSGPSWQTPAEARMARIMGADLIGWSIATEAILARRFGLPFAAIALVTSYAAGFAGGRPSPEQTATALAANIGALKRLLKTFVRAA